MRATPYRSLALVFLATLTACGDAPPADEAPTHSAAPTAEFREFEDALARWITAFEDAHAARVDLVGDGLDAAIVVVRSIVRQTGTMREQFTDEGDAAAEPDAKALRARRQVETMYSHNLARLNELRARRAEAARADLALEEAGAALDAAAAGLPAGTSVPEREGAGDVDALAKEANRRATKLHSTRQKRAVWEADIGLMEELKEQPDSGLSASWIESQIEEGREKLRAFDEREVEQLAAVEEARAAYALAAQAERVRRAVEAASSR
ncbi:MAG: hypothetical protein AAGB93_02955 [Planctomycetota bacterium]